MPTTVSHSALVELGILIEEACEKGDNVSAIAARAGVGRTLVSRLRNRRNVSSPTLENVESVLAAIGAPSFADFLRHHRLGEK